MIGRIAKNYIGWNWLRRGAWGGVLAAMLVSPVQAAEECEDPDTLSFSIIPTEETSQELDLYQPVVKYLEKRTGKSVDFYMPTSYSSVIEAMVGGWVDVAVFGPYSYVLAKPNLATSLIERLWGPRFSAFSRPWVPKCGAKTVLQVPR